MLCVRYTANRTTMQMASASHGDYGLRATAIGLRRRSGLCLDVRTVSIGESARRCSVQIACANALFTH